MDKLDFKRELAIVLPSELLHHGHILKLQFQVEIHQLNLKTNLFTMIILVE